MFYFCSLQNIMFFFCSLQSILFRIVLTLLAFVSAQVRENGSKRLEFHNSNILFIPEIFVRPMSFVVLALKQECTCKREILLCKTKCSILVLSICLSPAEIHENDKTKNRIFDNNYMKEIFLGQKKLKNKPDCVETSE